MPLETTIQTMKKEFAELRERMALNVGAEARYAIQQSKLSEIFKIKETICAHFLKYPAHEALCFGNGVSLYDRAVEFLNEEFGKRTLFRNELKKDKTGNPRYESLIWSTKKLEQRLARNSITKEIYDVVPPSDVVQRLGLYKKMAENDGTLFGALLGSMAWGAGLIAIYPPMGLAGMVFGPALLVFSAFAAPHRLTLEKYLNTAKHADTFLQEEIRPCLIR